MRLGHRFCFFENLVLNAISKHAQLPREAEPVNRVAETPEPEQADQELIELKPRRPRTRRTPAHKIIGKDTFGLLRSDEVVAGLKKLEAKVRKEKKEKAKNRTPPQIRASIPTTRILP